ncbi:uncharacterized protein HaLaN_17883 [Haematococcus lacustris]|uniref:EF-hand domain-containing protein n=1 Tax=Haematococcus lacustris TaxID=44745 RepID=A0A699ZP80_HAELA|nr:uncharacterized protein HaLaN_17883 [Haematococcus lacustris]
MAQEFAAALWARRRYSTSGDPLHHLFKHHWTMSPMAHAKEYDADNDGKLKADEIAAAFASHSVSISAEQVKALIATYVIDSETCDTDPDSAPATDTISAQMWPEWIHSLAISELHSRGGLQWLSLKPKVVPSVTLEGDEVNWVDREVRLPAAAVEELQWTWSALRACTRCKSLVVLLDGRTIFCAGLLKPGAWLASVADKLEVSLEGVKPVKTGVGFGASGKVQA